MKILFIFLIILYTISLSKGSEKKVVCYWNSFSVRNEGLKGMFGVKDIDPNICTHIIYTYVRFMANIIIIPDYIEEDVQAFINLKTQNPNVKLLIGVGGPRQGSSILSYIASTPTNRYDSSQKLKNFIDDYGFDGCDYDWQWPGQLGGSDNDKNNFVLLLEAMRSVLTDSKILSISVATRPEDIEMSYNITEIIQHVDFINLNTYDFHGVRDYTVTAFHSAYRRASNDETNKAEWNAESVVKNWLSHGAPADKLTLGIPTYGRSFTLSNVTQTSIGAPVDGLGLKSEYLIENSNIIPYMEICYNILTHPRWNYYWNSNQFGPYAVFNANQWVGFDDKQVIRAKIHLALDNDLGGLNYAKIDYDDFSGQCGGYKFPLVSLGYDALINGIIPQNPLVTTTPGPFESTTTIMETTPERSSTTELVLECPLANGIFQHPLYCTHFLVCFDWVYFLFKCPDGLYFDEVNIRCDYSSVVECNAP